MKYIKTFENNDDKIETYYKRKYVINNDFTDLYDAINDIDKYIKDYEIYYKNDENGYFFIIYAFIKKCEYTNSRQLFNMNFLRDYTINSKTNTSDVELVKYYIENTDYTHIIDKTNIEIEVAANKFNI